MDVVATRELTARHGAALSALLDAAELADDHPPLPEPQRRTVAHILDGATGGPILLAEQSDALLGCALLSEGEDGSTVVHVVVHPDHRWGDGAHDDVGAALVEKAIDLVPGGTTIHLWAMHATGKDDERAQSLGFRSERDVLQMRVPLPLPTSVVDASRPVVTRPFDPARDEEAWVDTNNRAFAGHPEQGAWSVEDLRDRLTATWVELDGFLVADDPDSGGLIGSCWTKVHRETEPPLGEIYVISVDPRHHGHGWGRALTVAGLGHLARRGVPVGMLYTDASNEPAVALYRGLGFSVDHVDRSYRRDP